MNVKSSRHRMRRAGIAVVVGLCLGAAAAPAALKGELPLRLLNWGDYIDARVLDEFTRTSGIRVVLDTYVSASDMADKLAAADPPYDVVVTPSAGFAQAVRAGAYAPLDYARLPNASGLDPDLAAKLATIDPDNRHAVDYMWFTTGIAYNVKAAADRAGGRDSTASMESWDNVFRPDVARKFGDCGIQIIDEPEMLFPIALDYLKIGPNPRYDADLVRASDLWGRLRALTKLFSTPDAVAALAGGDVCLAVVPADFAAQARRRASDAKNDVEIGFAVPREGAPLTFDVLAIPREARNVDAAYRLIDFLLRPEIAARNSSVTHFASGVTAARALMDPALANDPGIYPGDEAMKHLFVAKPYDARQLRLIRRLWVKSKTGKLGS